MERTARPRSNRIMRRALTALALVFVFAFGFGAMSPAPVEADPPSPCFYQCSCTGQPLFCCPGCKPVVGPSPIECPQIITC
jgi:hypothetical protein